MNTIQVSSYYHDLIYYTILSRYLEIETTFSQKETDRKIAENCQFLHTCHSSGLQFSSATNWIFDASRLNLPHSLAAPLHVHECCSQRTRVPVEA